MRIDSHISDAVRDVAGTGVNRQVQNTSKPEEGLNQNPKATRFDVNSVGVEPSKTAVELLGDVYEAIEKLNKFIQSQKKYVNFSVDEETNSTVIKFFKTETGEFIKQFPPEEILAMAAKIRKSIGWLFDIKA